MRVHYRAILAATFAVLFVMLGSASLQAQSSNEYGSVTYNWPAPNSYIDTSQDLALGMDATTNVSLRYASDRYFIDQGNTYEFRRPGGAAIPAGGSYSNSHAIPAASLQAGCTNGVINIELEMVFRLASNSENRTFQIQERTYSCGYGPELETIYPDVSFATIEEICGPENDEVSYSQGNVVFIGFEWNGPNEVFLYLEAMPGATFPDGASTTFAIAVTDENIPCVTEIEPGPQYINQQVVCGPANDIVTYMQPNVSVVADEYVGNDKVFHLTTEDGYVFPGGITSTTWTYTDLNTPCEVTPSEDNFQINAVCGAGNDVVMYDQDHVIANAGDWDGNELTFNLTAIDGYVFPGGETTATIIYTDANIPCEVTPDEGNFVINAVCGAGNDEVTYQQENVTADDGVWDGNTLTFKLTAINDYVFPGGETTTTITYTDLNEPCVVTPDDGNFVVNAVCGPGNDEVSYEQENVDAVAAGYIGNVNISVSQQQAAMYSRTVAPPQQ